MNEITKVHLGRQPFTIAVDAYKLLQDYLHAIGRQAGGKDVVEEVELRMAELLTERGIKGDKVVLVKDIEYLKGQLGEPGDFSDDDDKAEPETEDNPGSSKRLFRDTENAMLAGVCAGLGKFFGVDPFWVRLVILLLSFIGFSGVIIYIVLWLIVPEAKTGSDRLRMQGRQVTVGALKDVVERADVKGAARRASGLMRKMVTTALKVVLGLVGIGLMLGAIGAILGLTTASIYWALNPDIVPEHIFPVGAAETAVVYLAILFTGVIALFLLFGGLAMVKRKWILPGWALGSMVAVALASLAVGGALAADAVPKVRERYEAAHHTYVRDVSYFDKLKIVGNPTVNVKYQESTETEVVVSYWGQAHPSVLKTSVKDDTLTVDVRELGKQTHCEGICIFRSPLLGITIRGPKLKQVVASTAGTELELPLVQDRSLVLRSEDSMSSIHLPEIIADRINLTHQADGSWLVGAEGKFRAPYRAQEFFISGDSATLLNVRGDINLTLTDKCLAGDYDGKLYVDNNFRRLSINGKTFHSIVDIKAAQGDKPSFYNCVYIDQYMYEELINVNTTDNS